MVQGGGGGGRGEWNLSWVFVLLRLGETNVLRLDSPELDLHNQIIIVGFDGIWREMVYFDPYLGSAAAILDFTLFFKSQEITEVNTKSSGRPPFYI